MFRSSILAGVAGIVLLAGCSFNVGDSLGLTSSAVKLPQVVGDEPYAVKVGSAILAQGGTAADAATAMYFALSVTYPAAAGLGGGGVCLVRDEQKNVSEEFDFLPGVAADNDAYAIPGGVAGFAALKTAYGFLPWQKVIAPAESYARTGFPMTHALAARIATPDKVKADPALAALLLTENGQLKPIGSVIANPKLAETLAAIRADGPQTVYTGAIAKALAADTAKAGHAVSPADLAVYKASHGNLRVMEIAGNYVFLPSANSKTGVVLAALLETLAHNRHVDAAALAQAVQQVQAKLNQTSGADYGTTGFAVTDAKGQSVTCAVTMNAPFGSGHTAGDTGIVLAAAPNLAANLYLAPVIASESADGPAIVVGAAGGPSGSALLADALVRVGNNDMIADRKDLHALTASPADTANTIICTSDVCTALPDPGAFGLGLSVEPMQPKK